MFAINYYAAITYYVLPIATIIIAIATAYNSFVLREESIRSREESERARYSSGVETLLKFEERFNRQEMKQVRQNAAEYFLKDNSSNNISNVDQVLDFFEGIAVLVHKSVLDKWLAWHYYSNWIFGYYSAAEQYINQVRKDSPTSWQDLCDLYIEMIEIELEEHPSLKSKNIKYNKKEIEDFLETESNLLTPSL
ncbi:MAG: hypothetical protein KGI54_16015 [Pseudomonadota bacterium]|nr:hypothetical protein [Pseudomonadota bacterium]